MKPSPAPCRSRRSLWRWLATTVAFGAGGVVAAGLSYPRWAAGWVEQQIETRLASRLEQSVAVESVELDYGLVRLVGVRIGDLVTLDRVELEHDSRALWWGRIEVVRATATGGSIDGSMDELRTLAERLRPNRVRKPQPGRHRLVPETARIEGVQVKLTVADGVVARGELAADGTRTDRSVNVTLHRAELSAPGLPLLSAARLAATLRGGRAVFPLEIQVDGGGAQLRRHVALAGASGTVKLLDSQITRVELDLAGTFSDSASAGDAGKLWEVHGWAKRDFSEGELTLAAARFELGRVPALLAKLPLTNSTEASVAGKVSVTFGEGRARFVGDLEVVGLNVRHALLAQVVVHDVGFNLDFSATLDPAVWRADVEYARVERKGVVLEMSGQVVHPPSKKDRRYDVKLAVPPVPCHQVLEAIPSELVPSLRGFGLGGNFGAEISAKVDYSDLEGLELGGRVDIWKCSILRAPASVSASRLRGPFSHRVTMKDGRERIVRLFPGSGTFTGVNAISPYMIAAVLTTEDGGFYRHRGFLPSQFEEAMRRNLRAGAVKLGASTITMQMVKNVMLTHERTLSRKLQEMFLTWYVEQTLSKSRIMEIYLNIVELAPGIYGITRAAQHYFAKHPRDLNPLEAVYLAMMLPSPVRRHAYYCRGELTSRMDAKVRKMLKIMHGRDRISTEDYETWKDAELLFDPTERGETANCLEEIQRIMGGDKRQRAVSGLLSKSEEAVAPLDQDIPDRAYRDLPSVLEKDPARVDAPGRPAMEEEGIEEGTEP